MIDIEATFRAWIVGKAALTAIFGARVYASASLPEDYVASDGSALLLSIRGGTPRFEKDVYNVSIQGLIYSATEGGVRVAARALYDELHQKKGDKILYCKFEGQPSPQILREILTGYPYGAVFFDVKLRELGSTLPLGWWNLDGAIPPGNCKIAYSPEGAASDNDSKINLANPGTYNAVYNPAPAWDPVNGWDFVAGGQIDTNFNPTKHGSYVIKIRDAPTGSQYLIFRITANAHVCINPNRLGKVYYYNATSAGALQVVPGMVTGILGMAGYTAYRDGIPEAGVIPGLWVEGGTDLLVLSFFGSYTGKILKFSAYDIILDAGQMAAVTALM